MAIDYDIDQSNNVVFIRTYDVINIDDIKRTIEDVQADPHCTGNMSVLIDAREIRRAFFVREMDNLVSVLAGETAGFVERYSFIVTSNIALGVGRRFHFKALRAGLKLSIFRDHASALKWIKESSPATT